jgi:hypothetical protein
MLDRKAGSVQARSHPAHAGTKHLDDRHNFQPCTDQSDICIIAALARFCIADTQFCHHDRSEFRQRQRFARIRQTSLQGLFMEALDMWLAAQGELPFFPEGWKTWKGPSE